MSDVQPPAAAPSSTAPSEQKCPSGCVERTLNFRERNLLVGAARDYCEKKEHGDYKSQAKLARLSKLISFEETLDYFEMIDDHYNDAGQVWRRDKSIWTALRNLKDGLVNLEDFRKQFPTVDVDKKMDKPPLRRPEASPKEMRGEDKVFYFPSKLDVWVQDVIKAAIWQPLAAEYAVELCEKFGINDEDA